MTEQQSAKLLPSLFARIDEEQRITVLHIGPALPETVTFFSRYRCKLHFVDVFDELPIVPEEEGGESALAFFRRLFNFPAGTRFDICLFWDLFNFLDAQAVEACMSSLRPWLIEGSQGHGFAVHNTRTPQRDEIFSICEPDQLAVRTRHRRLAGYSPHPQSHLKTMLSVFQFDRSVLLADSRLELLLSVRFLSSA